MSELFGDMQTLAIYSMMYGPQRKEPCPMCTSLLSAWDGEARDVEQRIALVVTARSPIEWILAFKKQRGSVLLVLALEGFDALVLAEFPEIAPLESGRLAGRGAAGIDQIVGPLEIAFLPRLESQLHVGELALLNRDAALRFGLLLRLTGFLRIFVCELTLFHRFTLCPRGANRLPAADDHSEHKHSRNRCGSGEGQLVPPNQFLKPIRRARWTGEDSFIIEVSLEVAREAVGRFVAPGAIFLQAAAILMGAPVAGL